MFLFLIHEKAKPTAIYQLTANRITTTTENKEVVDTVTDSTAKARIQQDHEPVLRRSASRIFLKT